MKRLLAILCVSGMALADDGADPIHVQNIKNATLELQNTISNNITSAYYDFAAILEEIKAVKHESTRLKLMEGLVQPLFDVQDGQWKVKNRTRMVREKNYLLRIALETVNSQQYSMFKWNCHLKRLHSMKKELSFYADAQPPDEEDLKKYLSQNLKDEVERRRATNPTGPIVFSGPVAMHRNWEETSARLSYKKWLEVQIRAYEKEHFDAIKFKIDYKYLSLRDRETLMPKVYQELGRYPKWYQSEKEKLAK